METVPQSIREAWEELELGEFPESHAQAMAHEVGDVLADFLVIEWVESADDDLETRPVSHMIDVVEKAIQDLETFRDALEDRMFTSVRSKKSEKIVVCSDLREVSYEAIRKAMDGKPFTCSLVGADANMVLAAVNEGIDSHLEACYVPARGDSYKSVNGRLECTVSPESFPTLIRRLSEMDGLEPPFLAENMLNLATDGLEPSFLAENMLSVVLGECD